MESNQSLAFEVFPDTIIQYTTEIINRKHPIPESKNSNILTLITHIFNSKTHSKQLTHLFKNIILQSKMIKFNLSLEMIICEPKILDY